MNDLTVMRMEEEAREEVFEQLAAECHHIAKEHGFYDDLGNIEDLIKAQWESDNTTVEEAATLVCARNWLQSTAEQAAIARMHSELSEWLETVRKNPGLCDEHCSAFLSVEIEAADLIIRVLDTCGAKGYRIGQAINAKMAYNRTRPHKHGKNS